ncbi:MAG TPA: class II aldolase/adducin family protein [Gemmatimonadales bacterium]|nr:class II aldolase/adducin family protein [Gemmatimonadales bacterium]
MSRWSVARAVCEAGRRLAERGLIAGTEGNISARVGERVLVTPAGRAKGELAPADLVEVDLAGGTHGPGVPSSELGLHLVVLGARPDVGAVVHAHPPAATAFAAAGLPLDDDVLPELLAQFGSVPLVPYGMPGSPELGERVRPFIAGHDALLLANHGAVTFGTGVEQAVQRMESLEQGARILLAARLLGGARRLPAVEAERIRALWRNA